MKIVADQNLHENHRDAVSDVGQAIPELDSMKETPAPTQRGRQGNPVIHPRGATANGSRHRCGVAQKGNAAPVPNCDRHLRPVTHPEGAVAGDDQRGTATHPEYVIPQIIELWRVHQDWQRDETAATLRLHAICRRYCEGDKTKGAALLKRIEKGSDEVPMFACLPFLENRERMATHRKMLDRELIRLAKSLPIAKWAASVRGFGVAGTSLAGLVGECGDIGSYKSVAALWKRMGLAVIEGGRQRRVTGDAALEHGYSPKRHAVAWNLGACLIRAQKPDDPFRAYYEAEKARQLAKEITLGHAHNRALRHMTKRLLRDLYLEWRRMDREGSNDRA